MDWSYNVEILEGPEYLDVVLEKLARRDLWVVIDDSPEFLQFLDHALANGFEEFAPGEIRKCASKRNEYPFLGVYSKVNKTLVTWKSGPTHICAIKPSGIIMDSVDITDEALKLLEV